MAGLSRKRRELDDSSVTMLKNIGDLFRECREESGLTQKQAAVASTLTQAMISSIENGKSDIHVLTARRLAQTYGYDLEFALIKPEEEVPV